MAAGEHTYGWSQCNTSQGGPYGEHYGQPQGAQTIAVVLEGSAPPWRAYQDTQQQPSLRSIEMDPMSYPPPDMLRRSPDTNTGYIKQVPSYQQEQHIQQVSTLQRIQPYTFPLQPQLQPPCAQYQAQNMPVSHNRDGSLSRSPSREVQPERGSDRDRDRRDRERDREREREYSGRYASSSADCDSGRERDNRRHHDSRDREHDRDRDRDRRDDGHRDSRSSRRSRSPDHRQRNRSRSRNRSDYRNDDRQDRDRGTYDRSRYRDDERHDRDRSRDGRDRRDHRNERRYSRDEDDSYGRRRYPSRMDQELEAGLDGYSGDGRRSRSADVDDGIESWRSRRGQASNIVHVRNIPEDRDETELRLLFEGFSGLVAVNLVRSRTSGTSRGHAFVEFATEADAAVLMETKARYSLQLGGQTLHLDYASSNAAMSVAAPTNSTNSLDWVCAMCSVVNFARRVECHKCSSARPSNPQRVAAEANAPSAILKVSNLEQRVTDDDLRSLFLAHVSVKDVRIVLDKYTGLPRGLAFVEMFSVGEAARALGLLQGAVPPGGSQPLRLCYARDKFGGSGAPTGTAAGAEALEAAQAMSMYSNWEPKAFDARALDGAEAADTGSVQGKDGKNGAQKGTTVDASSAGSGQQMQGQDQTRAGFVYDQASGYWYDAASGYYYDANTGLYYHRSTNQWYSYDHTTGQYAAVGGGASTGNSSATGGAGISTAQNSSPPDKGNGTQTTAAAGPAVRQAQPSVGSSKTGSVVAKRTGAVIGAAPVLNAQGLLAAAALAEEKCKMAQKAAQQQQAKQQAAAKVGQQPARPQAVTPSGAAPAPVQGVIHRGKWAQRAQQ